MTPSAARAADGSTEAIRAWATVERTTAASAIPGRGLRSSMNQPSPRRREASSKRGTGRPTRPPVAGASGLVMTGIGPILVWRPAGAGGWAARDGTGKLTSGVGNGGLGRSSYVQPPGRPGHQRRLPYARQPRGSRNHRVGRRAPGRPGGQGGGGGRGRLRLPRQPHTRGGGLRLASRSPGPRTADLCRCRGVREAHGLERHYQRHPRGPLRWLEQLVRRLRLLVLQDLRPPEGEPDGRWAQALGDAAPSHDQRADRGEAHDRLQGRNPQRRDPGPEGADHVGVRRGPRGAGHGGRAVARGVQGGEAGPRAPSRRVRHGARAHPRGGEHPLEQGGQPRHRGLPPRRGAAPPLRRPGHHPGQGGRGLLPDRRAQRPHLVRPEGAARVPPGAQLRRLLDRVRVAGGCAGREVGAPSPGRPWDTPGPASGRSRGKGGAHLSPRGRRAPGGPREPVPAYGVRRALAATITRWWAPRPTRRSPAQAWQEKRARRACTSASRATTRTSSPTSARPRWWTRMPAPTWVSSGEGGGRRSLATISYHSPRRGLPRTAIEGSGWPRAPAVSAVATVKTCSASSPTFEVIPSVAPLEPGPARPEEARAPAAADRAFRSSSASGPASAAQRAASTRAMRSVSASRCAWEGRTDTSGGEGTSPPTVPSPRRVPRPLVPPGRLRPCCASSPPVSRTAGPWS